MKPGRYIILEKTAFWVHSDFDMLDILEITEKEIKYEYVGDKDKIVRCRYYVEFIQLKLAPHSPLMEELI
jgi:hypothetical protein